jgi:hypothetical protein
MLPKIILTLLQVHIGWAYAPVVRGVIPTRLGTLDIFLLAVVIAVLVWLVGHIGALVLKETPPPSNSTLAYSLGLALVFAALTLVPQVTSLVGSTLRLSVPLPVYPLIGAVLGYLIKK